MFSDEDFADHSRLGPSRELAVLVLPLDVLRASVSATPAFGVEVRVALPERWALSVAPAVLWAVEGDRFPEHGVGAGLILGAHYYLDRDLAGGYIGVEVGDIEVFVGGDGGRTVGGAAVFGYALTWESGLIINLGLAFGYWHRMGLLESGPVLPEILAVRLGVGWAR